MARSRTDSTAIARRDAAPAAQAPPPLDLTRDIGEISLLAADQVAIDDVLRRALAAIETVIPHDLAAVLRLEGGERLRVLFASGRLDSPRVRRHELLLSRFPTIRRALETRRPIALEDHHHASAEGDPYDGVLDLPHGHACMVVPLFAGDRSLGIITLDSRACGAYSPEAVRLADVGGQLVSLALILAEQATWLDRSRRQLKEQNRLLTEELGGADIACRRLEASASPAMRDVVRLAKQVAPADLPVLILGETGTGKEVVAQALHTWSRRADGPFVKLNCSAIPENLVESELFGHVRGAFSGAERDRRGRFLIANGGTLLLDEIGDMPLAAQSKLLRVLQEGSFEPLGSDRTVRVDVRVLAATHVDLTRAVDERRFRQDLYYRLAAFPLRLPPLRERTEDIGLIAAEFLEEEARRTRRGPWTLPPATSEAMAQAPWPGNVRELVHALERAIILQSEGAITPAHLGFGAAPAAPRASAARKSGPLPTFEENERRYFEELLRRTGGKLYGPDGAAGLAGLKPTTLRSRLLKLGLR
jgi:transcriptional regulator with GAF, ATPase, and Fis domain